MISDSEVMAKSLSYKSHADGRAYLMTLHDMIVGLRRKVGLNLKMKLPRCN